MYYDLSVALTILWVFMEVLFVYVFFFFEILLKCDEFQVEVIILRISGGDSVCLCWMQIDCDFRPY